MTGNVFFIVLEFRFHIHKHVHTWCNVHTGQLEPEEVT